MRCTYCLIVLSYSYDGVEVLVNVTNDIMWRCLTVSLGCFCLFIIRWLNLVGFTLPFFLLKMRFGRGGFSRCEYLEVLISPKAFNFLGTVDILLCISGPDSLAVVSLPVSSFFLFWPLLTPNKPPVLSIWSLLLEVWEVGPTVSTSITVFLSVNLLRSLE